MANTFHKDAVVADGIHIPYSFEYADSTAREGASGFVAGDLGKFARQQDDGSIWVLTATTPTWATIMQTSTTYPQYDYYADQFLNPNNADWAVNALAPVGADSNNAALMVRSFDDTTEEGVGLQVNIPSGVANIIFYFVSRAESAPGGAVAVVPKIYVREIPDNAAVESWDAGTNMTAIDIPTNENFQYDSQTIALTTLSLVAGRTVQIEITRVGTDGSDTLTGDWNLHELRVAFS